VNYSSFWKSSTFSSTVEPTIYLLAFGFGFGSIVSRIGGYDYVDFVGTGTVATAVLFSSAFPAMFGTFVKYQFQRTYDAILAAPVDTEELVTAEALWIATRAGVYGCVPMLVAMVFGLDPSTTASCSSVMPCSAGTAGRISPAPGRLSCSGSSCGASPSTR
jgi:lipooligosaccharide transport system permease protein